MDDPDLPHQPVPLLPRCAPAHDKARQRLDHQRLLGQRLGRLIRLRGLRRGEGRHDRADQVHRDAVWQAGSPVQHDRAWLDHRDGVDRGRRLQRGTA